MDIIRVLAQNDRPRKYWDDLKRKLKNEGSELSEKIGQLKMRASDGKFYLTDLNNGSSIPQINNYSFDNVRISFPVSIDEQKTIVKKLDQLSEQTKKLESIYQKKLKNIEELKKSILNKVFKGGGYDKIILWKFRLLKHNITSLTHCSLEKFLFLLILAMFVLGQKIFGQKKINLGFQ